MSRMRTAIGLSSVDSSNFPWMSDHKHETIHVPRSVDHSSRLSNTADPKDVMCMRFYVKTVKGAVRVKMEKSME